MIKSVPRIIGTVNISPSQKTEIAVATKGDAAMIGMTTDTPNFRKAVNKRIDASPGSRMPRRAKIGSDSLVGKENCNRRTISHTAETPVSDHQMLLNV